MKKTLAVLATFAIAVGAFAQGKVVFGNANHPITLNSDPNLVKAGYAANTAAPQAGGGNDVLGLLSAQLWAGTTAGNMALVSTVGPAGLAGLPDGIFRNTPVTLAGIPSGAAAFFQIFLWETTAGNYDAALNRQPATEADRWWYGSTAVFTATPGAIAGTPIANSPGWPNAPITLSANAPGVIPEPSTFVLAGLGIASLLLFRRRK
jgi:hypothetical protein